MKSKLILLLCASMGVSTMATGQVLPKFTSQNDTTWYFVKFKTGGAQLADKGANVNLQTAQAGSDNAQKWALIGTKDNFVMKSKLGHYVAYSGKFKAVKENGVELKLVQSSLAGADDCWEIQRKTSSSSMNQHGGAGVGKELGEWNAGDKNNPLSFIETVSRLPIFAQEGVADTWYFIKFGNSGFTLSDAGAGQPVITSMPDPIDTQLWKFVGNKDGFQMVNKAGRYAYIDGTGDAARLKTKDTKWDKNFCLATSTVGGYTPPAWEIHVAGQSGKNALNQWGGKDQGVQIGLWNPNDGNNPVFFTERDAMVYADYKVQGISDYVPANKLTLWYTQPTTLTSAGNKWMEYSLPIGNGQFGASIFGGVLKEEIQFNEKTLWSGTSKDIGVEYGDYENFGSVFIESLGKEGFSYGASTPVKDYYRQLDLTNATASVSFKNSDKSVTYTREYISSYPDKVVAMNLKASQPGKLSLRFTMVSGKPGVNAKTTYANGMANFHGKLQTVSYDARLKVVNKGGKMTTDENGIVVDGADEILVILGGATDFDAYSPTYVKNTDGLSAMVEQRVNAAAAKSWNELYQAHVSDFQTYFNRVSLNLEGSANTMPTDELVRQYAKRKTGFEDYALMLEQLYFNYGRYLMLGSSRGVDLPSNLQGIWNNSSEPAWNSDIHANINVQMNYWPAEPTNLSELHMPFINYITNMAMNHTEWQGYAKRSGQTKGWTCYTENNIFGGVGSFAHNYVIANAWYCTHLWQHYRYTLDKEYLKKVFPTMWSASEYWIERLKLKNGEYVCPNEYSPEHGPSEDGVTHAQQLVWDLFANTSKAAEILGKDCGVSEANLKTLNDRLAKLDKGLATEKYTGKWGATKNGIKTGDVLLREWKYSTYEKGADGHRHVSHLMCVYPFNQVTASSPYFQAAINSLKLRGDASTGWSMGWKINLWARMLDGDHAHDILELALRHHSVGGGGIYYNLYDSHSPFQIDGNFGATAGIAEMLMQSQTDTIQVLPALPAVWKNGNISGLKAVGDFTVDVAWNELKPQTVSIVSNQGAPLVVAYPNIAKAKITVDGVEVAGDRKNVNAVAVPAKKGAKVVVDFTSAPTVGIENVAQNASKMTLVVNDGWVTVGGVDVQQVVVSDMSGRSLVQTDKAQFRVPAEGPQVLLVQVTDKNGNAHVGKVVLR